MHSRLSKFSIWALILLSLHCPLIAETTPPDDGYITGYLTSVLERELYWPSQSYKLMVKNNEATIELIVNDPIRATEAMDYLRRVPGLDNIAIRITMPGKRGDQKNYLVRQASDRVLGEKNGVLIFPTNDFFHSLLADPKEQQFFISFLNYKNFKGFGSSVASVGYGDKFGILRIQGKQSGDGFQFNLAAGLFAQFDMNSQSHDLVNADYTLGIPMTFRYGATSGRLRVYHQSSHLGDEFLLDHPDFQRINLSYEAAELLIARQGTFWRVYGGGETLFDREPKRLKTYVAHGGIELMGSKRILRLGKPVAGIDLKCAQGNNWDLDKSFKAGLEFAQTNPGRHLRFLLEAYRGHAPHGQFSDQSISYYGFGTYLGF